MEILMLIFIAEIVWQAYRRKKSTNRFVQKCDRWMRLIDVLELCMLGALVLIDFGNALGHGFYVNAYIAYPNLLKVLYISAILFGVRMIIGEKFIRGAVLPFFFMLIIGLYFDFAFRSDYSWSEIQTPDAANTYVLFFYNSDPKDGESWHGTIYQKKFVFLTERAEYDGRYVYGTLKEEYISWQEDGFVFTYQPADTDQYGSQIEEASVFVPY